MSEAARVDMGFVAGLASRRDDSVDRLDRVMRARPVGFAPADLMARIEEAFGPGPKHFTPAGRADEDTGAWHPNDAEPPEPEAFIDPAEAAHARGYAEGFAEATAAASQASERNRVMLAGLAAALRSDDRIDRDGLAQVLRQTVLALVRRVVGEAGVSGDLLTARVEAAADLLADKTESAILRLNPEDVPLVQGHLPETIFAIGDAAVVRGSFVLEAASTIVEDGPELWLDQLTQAIERVAVPVATC